MAFLREFRRIARLGPLQRSYMALQKRWKVKDEQRAEFAGDSEKCAFVLSSDSRSGVVDVERNSPNPADVPYRTDDGSKSGGLGKGIGEYRADVKWIP